MSTIGSSRQLGGAQSSGKQTEMLSVDGHNFDLDQYTSLKNVQKVENKTTNCFRKLSFKIPVQDAWTCLDIYIKV